MSTALMKKGVLLFFLLLAVGASAGERAGKVIAIEGRAYAITEDKEERTLIRGAPILIGETMIVDNRSKMNIKLTDGSILDLFPNTEYKINSYVYDDKKRRGEYVGSLIVGGFRQVTGRMTKNDPENSKIETPVATIGIRGTEFQALYRRGKLIVECVGGLACICNQGGELVIGPKEKFQSAIVISSETAPEGLFPCR